MIVDFTEEEKARESKKVKIRFMIFINMEEIKLVIEEGRAVEDLLLQTEFTATFEKTFWTCKSCGLNFMAETAKEVAKIIERYLVLKSTSNIIQLLTIDIT